MDLEKTVHQTHSSLVLAVCRKHNGDNRHCWVEHLLHSKLATAQIWIPQSPHQSALEPMYTHCISTRAARTALIPGQNSGSITNWAKPAAMRQVRLNTEDLASVARKGQLVDHPIATVPTYRAQGTNY